MVKKLFALASMTALTGVVASVSSAGCSTTTTTTEEDSGTSTDASTTTDAKKDTGTVTPTDSGPGTCPTTDAIDATQYQYKAANKQPGACTSAMIDALVAFVDGNKTAKYADVKNSVTDATCKACLFTVDPTWGPLVENAKGELILINSGGCIEAASGKLECGKAYHQFEQCLDEACVDCPEGDDTALSACYKAAAKGACKAANSAITSDCADAISTCGDLSTKYTFEAPAKALCVGISDAGDAAP